MTINDYKALCRSYRGSPEEKVLGGPGWVSDVLRLQDCWVEVVGWYFFADRDTLSPSPCLPPSVPPSSSLSLSLVLSFSLALSLSLSVSLSLFFSLTQLILSL